MPLRGRADMPAPECQWFAGAGRQVKYIAAGDFACVSTDVVDVTMLALQNAIIGGASRSGHVKSSPEPGKRELATCRWTSEQLLR